MTPGNNLEVEKAEEAFRTISEVAGLLKLEPHVLRFWESKFKQIQPIKRVGGRRLYRPEDVQLVTNIKKLLHDQGMTIKGVQKILREQGIKVVREGDALAPANSPTQDDAEVNALNYKKILTDIRQKLLKARDSLS